MPSYANGHVPEGLLVVFRRGYNTRDGNWTHSFPPATYARHLALVAKAKARTGRDLALNYGWTAYRPLWAQTMLKQYYTTIGQPNMAARPGTSSHGGFWEGQQTMAGDYANWAEVYAGFGGRAAFADDCRAVGLLPNMIVPARGYPDEPWHVIDPNPWGAVPAFDGVFTPFQPEEDMTPEEFAVLQLVNAKLTDLLNAINDPTNGIFQNASDAADHAEQADLEMDEALLKINHTANMVSDLRNAVNDPNGGLQVKLDRILAREPGAAGELSDAELDLIAKATADERDRRERERLGGS